MATLDELEASLRSRWDRDTLAVYADELQSRGELRGELIVIDLRIEEVGPLPELVARRKELLAQWLATLPPGKVQHGFLDLDATGSDPVGQVRAALASPAAQYVRTGAIAGSAHAVGEAVALLAAAPRPGLARLVLRQWDAGDDPTLDGAATRALFAALPDLESLELDGYRICADAVHPNVRRMRISGFNAITSLCGGGPPWPSLAELDFAFGSHIDGKRPVSQAVLPAARLPALATLDLSRNLPGFHEPDGLGADVDIAAFAEALRVRATIRLPTPPAPAAASSSRRRQRRGRRSRRDPRRARRRRGAPSAAGTARDRRPTSTTRT